MGVGGLVREVVVLTTAHPMAMDCGHVPQSCCCCIMRRRTRKTRRTVVVACGPVGTTTAVAGPFLMAAKIAARAVVTALSLRICLTMILLAYEMEGRCCT